ncbi:spore germination protein [Paenibacillus yonginensis]|uniref:spore germination protein n=1 Tax=Paenibacillus yonginensis TaxID=1462996 RepID=UPI000A5A120D|nr:spore germination protein [Paenibacillus yonginensis]
MSWFRNKNNNGKDEPDQDQEQKWQQEEDHKLVQELIQELVQELAQDQDQDQDKAKKQDLGQAQIFDLDQDLDGSLDQVQSGKGTQGQTRSQTQSEDQQRKQLMNREELGEEQLAENGGEDQPGRNQRRPQDYKEEMSREFDEQSGEQEEDPNPGSEANHSPAEFADPNQNQNKNGGDEEGQGESKDQKIESSQARVQEKNQGRSEGNNEGQEQSREMDREQEKGQEESQDENPTSGGVQNHANGPDSQDKPFSASPSKSDGGESSSRSKPEFDDSGSSQKRGDGSSSGEPEGEAPLGSDLQANLARLKTSLENCSDIIYRPFKLYSSGKDGVLVYLDGMCDSQQVEEAVLRPLMEGPGGGTGRTVRSSRAGQTEQPDPSDSSNRSDDSSKPKPGLSEDHPSRDQKGTELPEEYLVTALHTSRENKFKPILQSIMKGQTAVLMDGESEVLIIDLIKMEQRSIGEPTSEKVVRGPRDGFTESLRTNTSLIRRRIVSPRLKAESLSIGTFTRTNIALMYIDGIAKNSLVEEVKGRIKDIDVDGLLYSQDIEEYIEDSVWSPFPQIQNTERPDVAAASLLEGKVVIIVDNSPIVLIAPMTYWAGLQAADDYTERPMYASLIRWLRYIFVHISLLLPSLYVALTTFHPEVIPGPLLISIASAREGVPFPAMIEALLMEIIFEGLREAGIRLPQQVGPAVSIAGALVIGQAVVDAGIVSSSMVIIVSLTGIASFAFPMYNIGTSFRMLRFPLLLISGFIGFYGVMLFLILMTVHLVSLRPFGIPYMAPASPLESSNLRDILIRAPKWKMNKRMGTLTGRNRKRSPGK